MSSLARSSRFAFLLAATIGFALSAPAKDHFLTIGGGYDAQGNQLSLERNVIFQQSVLAERRPDRPPHDVFFADADEENPDLQVRNVDFLQQCPPARRIMAELFGDADAVDIVYRNNQAPNLSGPAELAFIKRHMRKLGNELKSGDRLIIYFTGHGGAAEEESSDYDYEFDEESQRWKASSKEGETESESNSHNTSFYCWNHEAVLVSEFVTWLDRLPDDVQVVLVMVQCYAGGFAHAIFHQADANLGLSSHARCGFFAQVHDRGAAGCTPDANEADYEEYSSYFWGALRGRTRTGEPILTADYNGDGQVSFAEAHAYAIIESDTIDIPVRTTATLLHRYSHTGKGNEEADDDARSSSPFNRLFGVLGAEQPADSTEEITELAGSLASLAQRARPDQRAILERLPLKLDLGENPTVERLEQRLQQIRVNGTAASVKLRAATETRSRAREQTQGVVREIWPELHNELAPLVIELASERGAEFVARVEGLAAYRAWRLAEEQIQRLSSEHLKLVREEALAQRLLQTCEQVVLAANLSHVASGEIVHRYEQLLAMEESLLTEPAIALPAALTPLPSVQEVAP